MLSSGKMMSFLITALYGLEIIFFHDILEISRIIKYKKLI